MAQCKLHKALRYNITSETLLARNIVAYFIQEHPSAQLPRMKRFPQKPILISFMIVCVTLE